MKKCVQLIISVGLIYGGFAFPARNNAVSFISNGTNAADNQFPYHVSVIFYKGDEAYFLCSGAILNESRVITTASALLYNSTIQSFRITVHAGSTEIFGGGNPTPHIVTNIQVHEHFNSTTYENDIAVLQVTPLFNFTTNAIKPVTVSTNWTQDTTLKCVITSFADPTQDQVGDGISETLEYTSTSRTTCPGQIPSSDTLFCITNLSTETNTTDKGSPMVCNNRLVGIVTASPARYLTNIANYYDWLFPTPVQTSSSTPSMSSNSSTTTDLPYKHLILVFLIILCCTL